MEPNIFINDMEPNIFKNTVKGFLLFEETLQLSANLIKIISLSRILSPHFILKLSIT